MLPRRVPWTSRAEFEEVFTWLFANEGKVDFQQRALDRISVWNARGSCPQAIDATADLIDATLQVFNASTSRRSLRLICSMAIIRFVNGLVDPLQQSYHARSVASIAAQLGLPLSFVELRHAATHENLPSLPVLQDATKRALDWLYQGYWLPQMKRDEPNAHATEALRNKMASALRSYRKLRTTRLRDLSAVTDRDLEGATSTIEKLAIAGGGQQNLDGGLGMLLDHLVIKSGLAHLQDTNLHTLALSSENMALWNPLLERLSHAFDGFDQMLTLRLLDVVCAAEEDEELSTVSSSDATADLAAWAVYMLKKPSRPPNLLETAVRLCLLHPNSLTLAIMAQLSKQLPSLQELIPLAKLQISRGPISSANPDIDAQLDVMDSRLVQLIAILDSPAGAPLAESGSTSWNDGKSQAWQLHDPETWKPCPIGSLPSGQMSDLNWPSAVLTSV